MNLQRRKLLVVASGIGTTLVSGCSGTDGRIDDVVVYNETGEPQRGTLVVKRTSGRGTIFEEEFDLSAERGASASFGEPIDKAGKHEVLVTIDSDRTGQFTWNVPSSGGGDSQNEIYGLQILVRERAITFKQVTDGAD